MFEISHYLILFDNTSCIKMTKFTFKICQFAGRIISVYLYQILSTKCISASGMIQAIFYSDPYIDCY